MYVVLKLILILQPERFWEKTLSDGVTGNTFGFGPKESRFDSWSDNKQ